MTDLVPHMAEALRAVGVRPGGVLLVHAALKSLGPLPGGAETAVQGLLAALGDGGTLLMPALSYRYVTPATPRFDVRQTPSNVGALPEYFRTRAGTQRSVHPTHSVCGVGPWAAELLADHDLDTTPCGENSPFFRLPMVGGQVLFLGCGPGPNTSLHAVEELVAPPYLYGPEVAYTLCFADGAERVQRYRTHGFAGWTQRYERLAAHMQGDELRSGPVLQATVHLYDAPALWRRALAAYRADPLCFVDYVG